MLISLRHPNFAYISETLHICTRLQRNNSGNGAKDNDTDLVGRTALGHATMRGHVAICEILLARGADVSSKTNTGFTVLHSVDQFGNLELCELLLTRDAEVNIKTNTCHNPLILVAIDGFTEVSTLLLNNRANIGTKEINRATIFIYASQYDYAHPRQEGHSGPQQQYVQV